MMFGRLRNASSLAWMESTDFFASAVWPVAELVALSESKEMKSSTLGNAPPMSRLNLIMPVTLVRPEAAAKGENKTGTAGGAS